MLIFQAARLLSYALAGAVVSSSVGALETLGQYAPALRPLWTLLHVAALTLGLWLVWRGRQPAWMASLGRMPSVSAAPAAMTAVGANRLAFVSLSPTTNKSGPQMSSRAGWRAGWRAGAKAAAAGAMWAAWPCGLLQSALLVAALTGTAVAGAAAMAGFAAASSAGLVLGPWVWRRWLAVGGASAREQWLVRSGGLLLIAASAWALGHGLWIRVAQWCGLA